MRKQPYKAKAGQVTDFPYEKELISLLKELHEYMSDRADTEDDFSDEGYSPSANEEMRLLIDIDDMLFYLGEENHGDIARMSVDADYNERGLYAERKKRMMRYGGVVKEYDVYDEVSGKTLIIEAQSLEEAERKSESIDFDDYEDGDYVK